MALLLSSLVAFLSLALVYPTVSQPVGESTASPPANEIHYLPLSDPTPLARAAEIKANRAGYLYGPSVIGTSSFFPTGTLGDQLVAKDIALWQKDAGYVQAQIKNEAPLAAAAVANAGGIKSLASYELLYQNQWQKSNPDGVVPGSLTNYTQDIFFSMERLSTNPFSLKRLHPKKDKLPFDLEESTVGKITGKSLADLHAAGRLFFIDHSYQAKYPKIKDRYAAACSAYFYIHPASQEFLPLAIKTNVGSDLIYTPSDDANDWLLAKMMFNSNDFFFGQVLHLDSTHAVAEIVHEAALRTISEKHPVRAFLDHLMYQAYAIRPVGDKILFNPGGAFDQIFSLSSDAVREFEVDFYTTSAGLFQANYFRRSLADRGLLGCSYGPPLAHFPFAQDAGAINEAQRQFAKDFVDAYYSSAYQVEQDTELQSWLVEATQSAKVLDFPPAPLRSKRTLIDILTHMAYLTGVNHHTLNTNTPSTASGVLPFHPTAFYQPIPTAKGIPDLLPYLPGPAASLAQISVLVAFNRPQVADTQNDLASMFSAPGFLESGNAAVVRSVDTFRTRMLKISDGIRSRKFDAQGLAQGMPFLWQSLDPRKIPFYLAV